MVTGNPVKELALSPTTNLTEKSGIFHLMREKQTDAIGDTARLGETQELILVIRGYPERFLFKDKSALILGRNDSVKNSSIDIDLNFYGAEARGVSRVHAQIAVTDECRLYVTDLDSTNGTFISGKQLKPYVPYLLHNGDTLTLGRLPMQIYTRMG